MQFILRPSQQSDIKDLLGLAVKVAPGMTTFPPDEKVLHNKIKNSRLSFKKPDIHKDFLFVLEEIQTGKVVGTAGIYGNIGIDKPFFSFKVIREHYSIKDINGNRVSDYRRVLHLDSCYNGHTEVGTLILDPLFRRRKLGEFLAKSRYLFLAQFSDYFGDKVLAELRGWSDENHISPFWESLGKKFFNNMTYVQADLLSASTDNQFISDLMPKLPIYVDMLSSAAKEVMFKAHDTGAPALKMLIEEGFSLSNTIDIFDGGPTADAPLNNLKTVRDSELRRAYPSDDIKGSQSYMICGAKMHDIRIGNCVVDIIDDELIKLTHEDMSQLRLTSGDLVRCVKCT